MKKFTPYILTIVLTIGLLFPTHFVHAWSLWPENIFPSAGDLVGGILAFVFQGLLSLMSYITGISGLFLNWVLKYTIVEMKDHISGFTGINIAWKVIRDLMNIAFIFMLVYEGILLIIGQGNLQNIKKFITGIVLASLLINFSLFFTKVLIDASNVVTIGFYNSIIAPPADFAGPVQDNYGLSDPITRALGLTSLYGTADGDPSFGQGKGVAGILIMAIGSGLVLLITAFVFFAVSILFIIRYVTLIILLMLSPVAYMGMALPFMKPYAKQWWESLKGQLLFAPIYMIMTWVVLTLMSSQGFVTQKSFSQVFNGNTTAPTFDSMGILLNFAVIIGLLIASLITAKSSASQGSKLIGQATGKLSAFAGGVVMGGAGRLGRATIGRAGSNMANDEDLKKKAAEGNIRARIQLAAANRAATSSFDARATEKFGDLSKTTGFNFGKVDSKKENFRAIRKDQDEKEAKKAEQYKPSEATYAEAKDKDAELKKQIDEAEEKLKGKEFNQDAEKKKREEYEKTDEWKNSPEAKAEVEAKEAIENYKKAAAEVKESENKIAAMQEEANKTIIPERKTQIEEEIKNLKNQNEKKKTDLVDIKKLSDERQGAIDAAKKIRDEWQSEEKKALGEITKRDEKENENALNAEYKDRVGKVADRVGHKDSTYTDRSAIWRYTANTVGTVTNAVGLTAQPKTYSDRQTTARKIRAVAKAKTKKELAAEAAMAAQKEEDEEKAKNEGAATTTPTTPAPAPEPTPAPAPEPENPPEGTTT